MARATILLADNDSLFLETRAKVLEEAGYHVLCAGAPDLARSILEKSRVDAAILDIRLQDDQDEQDVSGLILAQECAHHLPKIILTHFPSYQKALAALSAAPGGFPPAVRFLEKTPEDGRGAEAMLRAVEDALQIGRIGFGSTVDEVTQGLNADYQQARQDAHTQTWISGFISLFGILVILTGVGVALWQPEIYPVGVIAATGGLVTEAVNYLFLHRLDKAHARVDRFHQELYQIKLLRTLNAAVEEIVYEEQRENTRVEILLQAGGAWFCRHSQPLNPGLKREKVSVMDEPSE